MAERLVLAELVVALVDLVDLVAVEVGELDTVAREETGASVVEGGRAQVQVIRLVPGHTANQDYLAVMVVEEGSVGLSSCKAVPWRFLAAHFPAIVSLAGETAAMQSVALFMPTVARCW